MTGPLLDALAFLLLLLSCLCCERSALLLALIALAEIPVTKRARLGGNPGGLDEE